MNTYILYDSLRDLYKIGKTGNLESRLKKLCIDGVVPYTVFEGDIEDKLHKQFAQQRTKHPFFNDGYTEWFINGGKFKEYIQKVKPKEVPYNTPHDIYEALEESGNLHYDTVATSKVIREKDYYKFTVGRKILVLLGYIFYREMGYDSIHSGVKLVGSKTFLTNEILQDVSRKFSVSVVSTHVETTINNYDINVGKKLYMRKIDRLQDSTPIYLIISEL